MHAQFCAKVWPYAVKARKRSCPERVVTMADAVTVVSKRNIKKLRLESWKALLQLVETRAHPDNEQLLIYGWHLLFGQPAVLAHRASNAPPRGRTMRPCYILPCE